MSLTPKPWKYGTRRDGSKWLSLGDPTRGQHRQGDLVATKEDADLICGAPDLLEALKDCRDALETLARQSTFGLGASVEIAINSAEMAIAKAEGRSDAL